MGKTDKQQRRTWLLMAAMLLVALGGVYFVDVDGVGAQKGSAIQPPFKQAIAGSPAGTTEATAENNLFPALVKMVSALVIVVVCIYGGMWLLHRYAGRTRRGLTSGRCLEVIETTHVGPKKTVTLVRVGRRSVLVGVTDAQVSVLTELDEIETGQLTATREEPAARESFKPLLTAAFGRLKNMKPQAKQAAVEA